MVIFELQIFMVTTSWMNKECNEELLGLTKWSWFGANWYFAFPLTFDLVWFNNLITLIWNFFTSQNKRDKWTQCIVRTCFDSCWRSGAFVYVKLYCVNYLWVLDGFMALAGNHQIVPKQMFSNSNNQRNWIHYIRNTCFHSCLGRCSYLCVVVQNSCPSNVNGGSDTTCNQHPNNNITKQPICPHGCIELVWSCSGSSIHVLCFCGKSRHWGWAKPMTDKNKNVTTANQIRRNTMMQSRIT